MSDNQDDDLVTSRRSFMAASAAPLLFGIGDDNDLGFFETHKVLDQQGDKATNYGIDPEVLAFGRGLSVADREDGGVRIQNTGAGAVESLDELPNVDVTALWQGPIDDRPSASDAPDGARYEATDQNLLYRNDPDNGWVVTNHGTESDPVPEGHYGSLDTDELFNDSEILITGPSGGLYHTIETSSSTTPVDDAIATANNAGGGEVWLPTGTIDHSGGPVQPRHGVTINTPGWRPGASAPQPHAIQFSGTDNGLQLLESDNDAVGFQINGGLVLEGPGHDSQTGNAVHIEAGMTSFDIDAIFARGWRGKFIEFTSTSRVFEGRFGHLTGYDIDPGDGNYFIDWRFGHGVTVDNITGYPRSDATGTSVPFMHINRSESAKIGAVNIGGDPSKIAYMDGSNVVLDWDVVNFEPSSAQSPNELIDYDFGASSMVNAPIVRIGGQASPNNVHNPSSVGHHSIPLVPDLGDVSNAAVVFDSANRYSESVIWEGPSSQVDNQSGGTLSNPITCLADLVTKTSTGTGP